MVSFSFLEKAQFETCAKALFSILFDNMESLIPDSKSREEAFSGWYAAVYEGLKKENRHIILAVDDAASLIIGFFQFYTTADTFMMEEIQLCREYQGKDSVFRKFYGFALQNIPENLQFVEAYADKRNHKSIGILTRLGLKPVSENETELLFHFKGLFSDLVKWYAN